MKLFFLSLTSFAAMVTCLRIDEMVHTTLTNQQIFYANKMGFPIPSHANLTRTPLTFKYPAKFSGIQVPCDMAIQAEKSKMRIEIQNRLMKNIVVFEKVAPDLLHIQFDSHLYVRIPKRIHLYIIQKKLDELIDQIKNQ